jgi:hypothetical protein
MRKVRNNGDSSPTVHWPQSRFGIVCQFFTYRQSSHSHLLFFLLRCPIIFVNSGKSLARSYRWQLLATNDRSVLRDG